MNNLEMMTTAQPREPEMVHSFEPAAASFAQTILPLLRMVQYLVLAVCIYSGAIAIKMPAEVNAIIIAAVALAGFVFLSLVNLELGQQARQAARQSSLQKIAGLYLSNNGTSVEASIKAARAKALQYSQELIKDYTKTRNQARNLYYVLQLATVILSGVTPILVLVDKLESGQTWLKWLPVICPAVASIVASVVTSFPFQENSIAANEAVELLEAEQEKFILGVTPDYRCYDSVQPEEQLQKAKQAIENYIVQVNNIHLKQVRQQAKATKPLEASQPATAPSQT